MQLGLKILIWGSGVYGGTSGLGLGFRVQGVGFSSLVCRVTSQNRCFTFSSFQVRVRSFRGQVVAGQWGMNDDSVQASRLYANDVDSPRIMLGLSISGL